MKNLLRLTLAICIIITAFNPLQATEYRGKKSFNLQQFLDEVVAKPGTEISQEPGLLRVDVPCNFSIYFFTLEEHPAHPAVVIRQIVEEDRKIFVKTQGYTDGDTKLFEQWLAQFNQ